MQIIEYHRMPDLQQVRTSWDALAKDSVYYIPSFAELEGQLHATKASFHAFAEIDNSQIRAIACFIYERGKKRYHIGATKLFDIPVKTATLFGSCIVGNPTERFIQDAFYAMIKRGCFDYIAVGRIFIEQPLYNAIKQLHGVITWQETRKEHLWWMIVLPGSFKEYFASLGKKTGFHIARDCRRFERQSPMFRIMSRPEEVGEFLRHAEEISRATYQWKLSFGICDDQDTRRHFMRLAQSGLLRCYLSYLDGEPCSFGWGDLQHGKFYFRQTGYKPKFRRFSPGTALIIKLIKDIIENTDCKVFHFQHGGEGGYKSRLATSAIRCAVVKVAPLYRPYSLFIVGLDQLMKMAKKSVGLMVERGPLKEKFRSILRRAGVGTF